jgi:hypothetical protein
MDDLLAAVDQGLEHVADWRAIAVREAVTSVRAGRWDPGQATRWLRGMLEGPPTDRSNQQEEA